MPDQAVEKTRAERIVDQLSEVLREARWAVEVHVTDHEASFFGDGRLLSSAQRTVTLTATRQEWEERLEVRYIATIPPCFRQTSRLTGAEVLFITQPGRRRKLDTYRALRYQVSEMVRPEFIPKEEEAHES